jgi:hypothetical protein
MKKVRSGLVRGLRVMWKDMEGLEDVQRSVEKLL